MVRLAFVWFVLLSHRRLYNLTFGACGGPVRKRALNSCKLMIVGLSNWNGSRFAAREPAVFTASKRAREKLVGKFKNFRAKVLRDESINKLYNFVD